MKQRQSNLELFRMLAMMGIVAWHALWYSGLATRAYADPWDWSNALLLVLGAWGKTGINCFILITGYFMCQRKLTLGRFLKVIGLTEFYAFAIFGVALLQGWQAFTGQAVYKTACLFIEGINGSFVPSYIVLLVLIPLLNAAIERMCLKVHAVTSGVLLFVLCILPSVGVGIRLGEIPWFVTLYLVAAWVRRDEGFYGRRWGIWLGMTLVAAISSMAVGAWLNPRMPGRNMIYYWMFPDAKVLAFGVAFCAFMFFRNLQIGSSRIINAAGGATFGIYLLHDGTLGVFRERVWETLISTENCRGGQILTRYTIAVIGVFGVCAMVDIIRKQLFSIVKGENV